MKMFIFTRINIINLYEMCLFTSVEEKFESDEKLKEKIKVVFKNLSSYISSVYEKNNEIYIITNVSDEKSLTLVEKASYEDLKLNPELGKINILIKYSGWEYGKIPIPNSLFSTWNEFTNLIKS